MLNPQVIPGEQGYQSMSDATGSAWQRGILKSSNIQGSGQVIVSRIEGQYIRSP